MAAIFWLSSIPGDQLPMPGFRFADKCAHFSAYALLGFLIGMRLRWRGATTAPEYPDLRGFLIGILYGASDEVHQLFVPMRQFAFGDFAADALGAAAGVWLASLLKRRPALSAG
jgi:VanZ family protein